ncbi:hypothetical protein [Thalassospira lucentensis]|uniref:hypothetical protein n=1 Tax=Thalassospira lucentensis TaxID=168935 RepID=UPI0003B57268|nr:hypothetical protein [Thalassospira lucentensis]RCK27697.1 hypothetical protein TH1_10445 [Thalassospira lucentensis MCCC 1A00383 = DSM 14000]
MGNLISDISNIVVALAAVCGAFTAWKGLSTWRKETEWKIKHELSHRILVNLYKLRETIDELRFPAIAPYEMEDIPQETVDQIGHTKADYRRVAYAYKNRGDRYYNAEKELKASRLEARANWGNGLEQHLVRIDQMANELLYRIDQYLSAINPETDERTRQLMTDRMEEISRVIYDPLTADDDWRDQLDEAQQQAEDFIRNKLERATA